MTLTVSFLIPTYNASSDLRRCLAALHGLDIPAGVRVEVLVADGGSVDGTLAVCAAFGVSVLDNPRRSAEDGKRVAFDASRGDLVVFLDADNVVASSDWLCQVLAPLADETVDCVESNYLPAPDFSSVDRYVSQLVIADPVARLLASRPCRIVRPAPRRTGPGHDDPTGDDRVGCDRGDDDCGGVGRSAGDHCRLRGDDSRWSVKVFARGSVPVAGANGFVWRRPLVERYADDPNQLNEVALLRRLAADRPIRIANVAGVGIHHYYAATFRAFLRKRTKIAGKHLARRRAMTEPSWVDARGRLRLAAATLYCASVVGPTGEALWRATRARDLSWLWHPVASLATVVVYARAVVARTGSRPASAAQSVSAPRR